MTLSPAVPEQEGLTQEQAVLAEREACAQIADSAATIARCKAEPGLQIEVRALWDAVADDALEVAAIIRARPLAASPAPPAGRKATPEDVSIPRAVLLAARIRLVIRVNGQSRDDGTAGVVSAIDAALAAGDEP